MQIIAADSVPQPKRRKLGHNQDLGPIQNVEEDDLEKTIAGLSDTDLVIEEEEGPEASIDGIQEDEDVDEDTPLDISDPFEAHFANPNDNVLSRRLKFLQQNQYITQKMVLPDVGKATTALPEIDDLKTAPVATLVSGPGDMRLKHKLAGVIARQRPSFDALERSIAPLIFNYQDILYCERNSSNSESLRRLTCLHAVNHIFKSVSKSS